MTDPKRPAVEQSPADWQAGYNAGLAGKAAPPPCGVDGVAWCAGLIEGRADRSKPPEQHRTQTRPQAPAPEA